MIRLIIDAYHMGSWNMACDLSIAKHVGKGVQPTTIRLYGWTLPTLSLGRFQKLEDIDFDFLKNNNIDIVRRPTGGRAVLHNNEITYLFSASTNHHLLPKNVIGSYKVIAEALIKSMEFLNIYCDIEKNKSKHLNTPACYDSPSIYEITIEKKKFIGSAQYRNDYYILQHGAIPNEFPLENYVNSFKLIEDKKIKLYNHLKNKVIDIKSILNKKISFEEMAEAFKFGFSQIFNEEIFIGELSNSEYELTKKLIEKFDIDKNP
ncbi:lipoate-protein ligase A [Marinitoga hydrogenitolerans DSM 16785]|uniref:Lipoate-protein ligase A n=1 Tax=Marinitoga hydrogenitolerans (strain DSM 16785 / JCM 12826 / AT1271) TaxID=1122195 RepID=A0A1M4V292_MARH1|nr:biotin/lipoate A/B protein ligase family protein [Marinitoga hydrogenitolerans]SHE63007.1 lipoate-protein ligase A [Marinitoga hydrogenitolerans DSM 16785]